MATITSGQAQEQGIDRGRVGRRVLAVIRVLLLYGCLLLLCLFILMPIGWMLTAALKPDTAVIFTFPPGPGPPPPQVPVFFRVGGFRPFPPADRPLVHRQPLLLFPSPPVHADDP